MNKFEKISEEQWMKDYAGADMMSAAQYAEQKAIFDSIELPTRGSASSAGYDFCSPIEFKLEPGQSIKIATGIKVQINEGAFLGLFPRSGLGFKYRLQLDNTVGIVDADYYNNKGNEGHIFIKITNDAVIPSLTNAEDMEAIYEKKTLRVKAGEKFAQGIFISFQTTVDDTADAERVGGLGSTGK